MYFNTCLEGNFNIAGKRRKRPQTVFHKLPKQSNKIMMVNFLRLYGGGG